ncbi:hypothetical protein AHAS_Ahas06G0181900 [Arachis hypogaea]
MEFTSSFSQTNFMGYYPSSQYDSSQYSNYDWEYHQETSNSGHSNSWSFASEPQDEKENHMGYFHPPENDASHDSNSGWEGNSSAPCDIHPKTSSLDQTSTESPFQNSPPTQTSMNHSRLSKLESMFEKYEEEMKKAWENQQTSSMKKLLKQMLSVKEEVEERESEEVIPNSSKTERHMKDKLIEPPIQKALDEDQTPKITQQPCLDIQEVKATNKSTNPAPDQASKLNQANFKRKLAERKPRKGTKAKTSPPLKSFLLTNWKKKKKVKNNMSS